MSQPSTPSRKPSPSRILLALAAAAGVAVLGLSIAGCNTVEGAGQDLQDASRGVRDAVSGD